MLIIPASEYERLRRQAEEDYPLEGCGILLGKSGGERRTVLRIFPCANVALAAATRYEIDPREVIRVQRETRGEMEIVGFYHSHPDHPAQPSPTDLEQAHWIGCSYVITGVADGEAGETSSFVLSGTREEDKQFVGEEFVVER
jgi:proteasome lid subunit RPN8/RPN11